MKTILKAAGLAGLIAGFLSVSASADDVYNACVVAHPNPAGPNGDPESVCKCITQALANNPKLQKEFLANSGVLPAQSGASDPLMTAINHCLPKR